MEIFIYAKTTLVDLTSENICVCVCATLKMKLDRSDLHKIRRGSRENSWRVPCDAKTVGGGGHIQATGRSIRS